MKLNNDYSEKLSKTTGIEIQSKFWGVNKQLSMELIDVNYFLNPIDPVSYKNLNYIHIKMMTINNICVIDILIWFIYSKK